VTAALTEDDSHQQDELAVAQNGGHTGSTAEDADLADAEGDDGAEDEDDMMDKISSSPSIDDGGYPLPLFWPKRTDSLLARHSVPVLLCSSSTTQACSDSSSHYEEKSTTTTYDPLRPLRDEIDKDVVSEVQVKKKTPLPQHHLQGKYLDDSGHEGRKNDDAECIKNYDEKDYTNHFSEKQLPEAPEHEQALEPEEYEEITTVPYEDSEDDDVMTIPYESSEDEDEDDDYDISYPTDSRFIDSGWGGECLQELEDIDFEFVYALHTFVATVEGQANATKGDTMVLLDDSNSYWWLVRVVKDSSIGASSDD
jgi:hypothetical protein